MQHEYLQFISDMDSVAALLDNPETTLADIDAALERSENRDPEGFEQNFERFLAHGRPSVEDLYAHARLRALDGIWRVLRGCGDLHIDPRVIRDLEAEVLLKVWLNHDSLLDPSQPAAPATRIWEFGYWAARAWKTTQLRLKDVDKARRKLRSDTRALNRPERVLHPSLDAIEAKQGSPEPDFATQENKASAEPVAEVKKNKSPSSESELPIDPGKMLCPSCETLISVRAIDESSVRLACGHSRGIALDTYTPKPGRKRRSA